MRAEIKNPPHLAYPSRFPGTLPRAACLRSPLSHPPTPLKPVPSRFVSALVAAVASLLVISARADTRSPSGEITPKEIRQGYRDTVILAKPRAEFRASADASEQREGRKLRRRWDRFDGLRSLQVASGESADEAIARLQASGRYEYVQRDYLVRAHATPNDASFSRQWSLANDGNSNGIVDADIGARAAWDIRTDASSVIVAVIDSGIRLNHPDLAANLWRNAREIPNNGIDDDRNGYVDDVYGIDAYRNNGNPEDDQGHGTHVAGIVGAVGNNGEGIAGVAWKVQIMPLKFLRSDGYGATSDGIECIDYAIRHGAHIINASWGDAGPVTTYDQAQRDAVVRARDAGIIFVAAAGNDGVNTDLLAHYPSSHRLENVLAVGMSTNRDDLPVTSNYGSGSVELFAPGVEIYSTWYTAAEPYRLASGTSMAAPHVAGALALLKAQFPADNYRQLINRLLRNVDRGPAFAGKVMTGGRLNLARALASTDNRPFNDDFSERARVSGENLSIRTVNTGATIETEPAISGQAAGATLWWEWQPKTTSVVRVSTDGSSYDTVLGVFSGTELSALTAVAGNDNETGKTTSRLEFTAQAGVTYQIVVGGKGSATGLTLLDIGAIPPNDNFASARVIEGRTAVIQSANAQATLETGEPRIRGYVGGKSLWYRWTAPSSDRFQFSLASDGFDPLLAIYTGASLSTLTLVASSDDADREAGGSASYVPTTAIVAVNASAGVTYYIQADGRGTAATPPPNAPLTLILNDSLWQGRAKSSFTNAPVVGPDGAVYAGSTDGYFHAFNADGSRRWPALNLNEAQQDTSAAALSPDGILYIGTGPSLVGTTVAPGKLMAVDSATGGLRWEIAAGTLATTNANNAIALAEDGTIYLHTSEGRLLAYTDRGAAGAQLKWSASVPGLSYASPTIAPDGTVYLGSDEPGLNAASPSSHRLYAFNPANGSVKWTFRTDNPIYTATAIDAAGNLYFGTLVSGRLYSLTPQGAQRWIYSGARLGTSSSPALSPDGATVYFAGYDGVLHAVNAATGEQRWTYKLGGEVRASSPAVDAAGVVYIGSYDTVLYAINANGTLNRTWSTGAIIRSSPAIAGTTLYIGSNDGGLYAFDIGMPAAGPWPQYRHNARRTGRAVAEAPVFALSPPARAAVAGEAIELAALVTGSGPFTYQWFKDGVPLAGATSATLALPAVTLETTGNYTLAVSNAVGTALSSPGAVVVRAAGAPVVESRLVNLSVRTLAGAGDRTLIVGFFVAGSPDKTLLIRAIGPTLGGFGVGDALADPRLQLLAGSTVVAQNDDWGTDQANTAALFASVGAFPLAAASRDSALARTLLPGSYTAQIVGASGTGTALAEVYDAAPSSGARLANLSARSQLGTGGDVLIAGFAISGNTPRSVLIRAVGPGLAPLGVSGALADPKLALFRGAAKIDENDQWRAGVVGSAFSRVGAFALPSGSRDAALLVSLAPGSYTAQVSGGEGIALVEVYEAP